MEPGPEAVVLKRDGTSVAADFDAVTQRNAELCSESYGRPLAHARENLEALTREVRAQFRTGMSTRELDQLTIAVCAGHSARHRDYSDLAARITVSDLHKTTPPTFVEAARHLGGDGGRLSEEMVGIAERAAEAIEARLDYRRDYAYTHFGIQTMLRSYLLRGAESGRATVERPQHAHMRVALGVRVAQPDRDGHQAPEEKFQARLAEAFEVYELLAARRLSHASPTVFNAGTRHPQHSSCYLLQADDDLESLLQVCKDAGMISKWAGGVGIGLSKVRAEGAPIRSTGGASSGLSRYVALLNACQLYVNQGGLRPGAYALYLEPWHSDIFSFLELGRVKGHSGANAPDLKYGLWVPDLFMETLRDELAGGDGDWPLFSPDSAPGLDGVHGEEFRALHRRYVREGRQVRVVKASEIITEWFKTVAQRGNPYVLFKDHINAKSNLSHVQTITHSNLCVSGETRVLTEAGQLPIASLVDQEVGVWNGSEWSRVTVRQTAAKAQLLRVTLDNGASLCCTPQHKFYDAKGAEVRAEELVAGTALEKAPAWPVLHEGGVFPHAYTHGLFCADGHYSEEPRRCSFRAHRDGRVCRKHARHEPVYPEAEDGLCCARIGRSEIHLYGEKQALFNHPNFETHPKEPGLYVNERLNRVTVHLPDTLPPKYEVPSNADLDSRLRWFEGYCDGGGAVCRVGSSYAVQVWSSNAEFLDKVRLMLQTMGCDPKITPGHPARSATIRGVEYECRAAWRLLVACTDLWRLLDLGFRPGRLDFTGATRPNRDARRFTKVVSTAPELSGPTFCFTEPLRHRGVFEGVLTGQCAEITIPSRYEAGRPEEAEYGVCNLAALPLASFLVEGGEGGRALGVDWAALAAAAATAVVNLDAVIDLNFDPTPACRRSNHRHRPVAVGVAGLADVFARLGLVYGSWDACALDAAIHATIYYGATQASRKLAASKGAFATFPGSATSRGQLQPDLWVAAGHLGPQWETRLSETTGGFLTPASWAQLRREVRKGVRNAYVTADMPTATSSQAAGQNEAFEPFTSNLYTRKTLAGDFAVLNGHLVRELEARGLWTEELRLALLAAGGSVQEIEAVPADLRRLFRTAREIDQRLLTRHAAARNPFLSQTQSLNYYFGAPVLSEVLPVLMEGWKAGLTTGSYYIHTAPATGAQNATLLRRPDGGGATAKSGTGAAGPAPAEPAPACSACQA
jgi:ribonucleoside-diphosphate reductase alpha chain